MTKQQSNNSKKGPLSIAAVVIMLILGALGVNLEELGLDGFGSDRSNDTTTSPTDGFESDASDEESVAEDSIGNDFSDNYEIYFTNPTCPEESERVGGVEDLIANDILRAEYQVDIASFDLDSLPIIDALIAAEEKGVAVRVVVDDEHTPAGTTNRLRRNGISVREDKRSALMHNKYVVIDGRYLWMGSMNFTTNGIYCNNNNMVRFDSAEIATNYRLEMDEMYEDQQFGARSPKNTETRLEVEGVKIENYFSAEADVAAVVARAVARADEEIMFLAFSFTSEDVGEAMIERAEDGVMVRGVFERLGSDASYSYYGDFRRAKLDTIDMRIDKNKHIMHHKVIIIDREITIFGSFNFTNNADKSNDENLLIVYDAEFASFFVEEFETVWIESKDTE